MERKAKRVPGIYDRHGSLNLTPANQARQLIFPERHGLGRVDQSENPVLQHALEQDGYLAFEDTAPHGPTRPEFLGANYDAPDEDWEDIGSISDSGGIGGGCGDVEYLIRRFGHLNSEVPQTKCRQEACGCHSGGCTLHCDIKKARNAKPQSDHAKFPRFPVPLICGQCLNSFG